MAGGTTSVELHLENCLVCVENGKWKTGRTKLRDLETLGGAGPLLGLSLSRVEQKHSRPLRETFRTKPQLGRR